METMAGVARWKNADEESFMKFGRNNLQRGFSLVDLLVIVAVILVVGFAILRVLSQAHHSPRRIGCTNNLKQVGLSFRVWAYDNDEKLPMQVCVTNGGAMELANEGSAYAVFMVMSNELARPKILFCPQETNRRRVQANVFAHSTPRQRGDAEVVFTPTNNISYFVGLDANSGKPHEMLAGDDHFQVAGKTPTPGLFLLPTNAPVMWRDERHRKQGNILFADGSVLGLTNSGFHDVLAKTGIATNRLAMP